MKITKVGIAMLVLSAALLIGCRSAEVPPQKTRVEVKDMAGLVAAAARDNQAIYMVPGNYKLSEILSDETIAAMRKEGNYVLLSFSGNGNHFKLQGVVIDWETGFRAKLRPPTHTNDIELTGKNNVIEGLEIVCSGDGASSGGSLLSIKGNGNTLRDCRFLVRGSFPYGYGDIFGKGGRPIIHHNKHSGVQILGNGTKIFSCRLDMRSFGHGFYIQKQAADILLENCVVEGVVRTTEEMLAETSGPAFDKDFRTEFRNHEGQETLLPGYVKSLSEDAFRTYDQNQGVTFRNCTAKNMRGGFELRTKQGTRLENCTAIGCERGFWVADEAVLENCRGDASHGPLLFVEGRGAKIDLELLPTVTDRKIHTLAVIRGSDHQITFRGGHAEPLPIKIGFTPPPAGEGMAPGKEHLAREVTLRNETTMPVIVGSMAERCKVITCGEVSEDKGKDTKIDSLK